MMMLTMMLTTMMTMMTVMMMMTVSCTAAAAGTSCSLSDVRTESHLRLGCPPHSHLLLRGRPSNENPIKTFLSFLGAS